MIWDNYKQKLIVSSKQTLYVIGILKNMIEFQYYDSYDIIVQIQLIPKKNVFQFSTYQSCNIFDYDYLVNDSKDLFPNQIQPRTYQINENIVFYINDISSQANLYINKKPKDSWIRNNLMTGYIRFAENDLQSLLVFGIYDNEIVILDLSTNSIIQLNQYFHTSNIISILYEGNDYVYLQSQQQQILALKKRINTIQIDEIIILSQGIAQYYFSKNSMQFIFTDYVANVNINLINISFVQGKLKGIIDVPIKMESRVVQLQKLNDFQIVILLEDTVLIYDISNQDIIKQIKLPIQHIFSNIKVDLINKRIFVQNQNTGSLVFDLNLNQSSSSQLNTFSTDLQFDEYFIYSVTGHSANIFFRKDLQFLINFRHFEMTYSLKKISYLEVEYLFMIKFLTKLSVYEVSPLLNSPIEKNFININQFTIINYSLQKIQNNQNDNSYQFTVTGFTLEGMFSYTSKIDQYNQKQSQSCSWQIPLSSQIYQEVNIYNQLSQQLISQNRNLNRLSVPISYGQKLRLPQIPNEIISNKFDLSIIGQNNFERIFVQNQLNSLFSITNLKFKNIEITTDPNAYTKSNQNNQILHSIDINLQKYPSLKQFMMEDVKLNEVQINVSNITLITIKNIIITNSNSNNLKNSLTQINLSNSTISSIGQIIIDNGDFYLSKPLIDINNVDTLNIKQIIITNGNFKSLDMIFSIMYVKNLIIEEIIMNKSILNGCTLLQARKIGQIKLNTITLQDNTYNSISSSRILYDLIEEESVSIIFDFEEIDQIQINKIALDRLQINSNIKTAIFQMNYIKQSQLINEGNISNISIEEQQNGIIFSLKGINDVVFQQIQVNEISFIQFLTIEEFKISKMNSLFSNKISIQNLKLYNYKISKSIIQLSSFDVKIENIHCFMIAFNSQTDKQYPAFQIQAQEILTITNSIFDKITRFTSSVIKISDSSNIHIENSFFKNIFTVGQGSSISIVDSNKITILTCTFDNNKSLLDSGTILFKYAITIIIKNCMFSDNTSENGHGGSIFSINSIFENIYSNQFKNNQALKGSGGVLYCQEGSIISVKSNYFLSNSAINGSGGTMLLSNCDLKELSQNEFNANIAVIGGAIRYKTLKPFILIKNQIYLVKKQNLFTQNKCIAYGKDIGSYPTILDVKNSFEDDEEKNNASIKDVQSGYKAQNPIYLRFIDEEMNEINFFDINQYPQIAADIKEEFSFYILQADSQHIGLLGDLKQGYTKDEFSFKFDLSYSYQPMLNSYLTIKSTQELPQFIDNQQLMVQKQFEIRVLVYFRKCQIGEVIQKTGQYILCYSCEQGFYSIQDPYSKDDITCQRCPIGSADCQGHIIQLQNGYWRSSEQSDVIVNCGSNEQNCQPQNNNTKLGCVEGHKGPLCQECDVYGDIWGESYAKISENNCMRCGNFNSVANLIIFILIFSFIVLQNFIKAYKQVVVTKKYVQAVYLAKIGSISPNIERTQTVQASLMKILLNYFQFVMIVNSLEIPLPTYFTAFNLTGGDTTQNTINRIDCFLFSYKINLPIYIIRVLWVNSQPLIIFLVIEILSQFKIQRSKVSSLQRYQSFSCIKIGEYQYILSELNERCLSDEHIYYFYVILLPLGVLWIFFVPLFLFYRMKHYKNQMNQIKIIYRYGYLYQEYQHEHYYWDIIKIFIRSLAIVSINVLNFRVLFKGLIILGLIFLYMVFLENKKPYLLQRFNKLDRESCLLVIITLYLLYVGYLSDNNIINLIMTFLIGFINTRFILKMCQLILIQPISPLQGNRNIFQQLLYKLKIKFPYLFSWVQMSDIDRTKVFLNWKKVRAFVNSMKEVNNRSQSQNRSNFQLLQYLPSSQRIEALLSLSQHIKNSERIQTSKFSLLSTRRISRSEIQKQQLLQEDYIDEFKNSNETNYI